MDISIAWATLWVFLGELYGNFVWWGSLVTQAVLQNIVGMNIKSAMALDNAAVIGSNIWLFIILIRQFKIKWRFILLVAGQVIWAIIGSQILVLIDESLLKVIFLWSIVALVLYNFLKKNSKEEVWEFKVTKKSLILLLIIWLITGIYNSAFVIGDWIISLLMLTWILRLSYQKSIFLLVCSMLIAQPVAVYNYIQNDLINRAYLIPMIFATTIWWLISWYFMDKIHSHTLEKILQYLSIALVWYLIFWLL